MDPDNVHFIMLEGGFHRATFDEPEGLGGHQELLGAGARLARYLLGQLLAHANRFRPVFRGRLQRHA
jgi:hypothetical protein